MRVSFKYIYSFILILCLPFGFGSAAHAQLQDSIPAATQPVQVRQPDNAKLEKMRMDEDFQYYDKVQTGSTFWERVKYKIIHWLRELFYAGQSGGVWEYVIYVLIAATISFIVIKMYHVDPVGIFGRKVANTDLPYDVFEENIHELDLQGLIKEAVAQRDYRKAIRLHYLHSLKQLTDRQLIDWKPGKTNRSYTSEIEHPELKREFELLTNMFEYVWYGGAALGDALFQNAQAEFVRFDQQLKQYA